VTVVALINAGPDGRESVQAKLHELSEYGYADLELVRNARGRMVGKSWHIYDHPMPSDRKTNIKHV
jgi:hypothetical protein